MKPAKKSSRRCSPRVFQIATLLSLASLPLIVSTTWAASYDWDPVLSTTGPSFGSGTWDTVTPEWVNTAAAGTDTTFVDTNAAIFGGTSTGTATVTLGEAINASGINVNSAGYTFTTSATDTLTVGTGGITTAAGGITTFTGPAASVLSGGSQTWSVAAGDTLQFGAGFSSATAANTFQLTSNGTTNITGAFTVAGRSTLAGTATGGIINLSGAESFATGSTDTAGIQGVTTNVTASTTSFAPGTASAFYVGGTGSATLPSALSVTGGTASVTSNTRVFIGDGTDGTATAGNGTLTVGGGTGTGTFTTGTTTNATAITLGNTVATGTINLNANGVFSTNRAFAAGAAGKGVINFNGGTLTATGTALAVPATVTTNVLAGGATINSGTFAITVATPLLTGVAAGSTDGGLNKTGSGALVLTGANTYNGGTQLTAGIVAVGPSGTLGTGPIVFNNGGGGIGSSDGSARTISNVLTQSKTGNFVFGSTSVYTGALNFTNTSAISVGGTSVPSRNFTVNVNTTLAQGLTGGPLATVKSGAGSLTFNGSNAGITGGSFGVTAGAVFFNSPLGAAAGAPTVSATATGAVGGSGQIFGTLSLAAGTTLTPGMAGANSIGTLTTGALSLTSTTNLVFDLGTTAAGGSDRVAVNGNLTLGGTLTVNQQTGFGAGNYELFSYTGTLDSTTNTTTVASAPTGFNYAVDTTTIPGEVLLDVTAVPEPSTWAWLAGGFGGLLSLTGRRKRCK